MAPPDGYRPIPAISLSHEPATITAIANDVGNDLIFLRQLIAHAQPHDVAIAISTSGGSKSVVAALEEARKRGLLTVALLGYDGGEIGRRGLADRCIVVRSDYIPRIQEVQASVYHVMRELHGAWRRCLSSSCTAPRRVRLPAMRAKRWSGSGGRSSSTTSTRMPTRSRG